MSPTFWEKSKVVYYRFSMVCGAVDEGFLGLASNLQTISAYFEGIVATRNFS